MGHSKQGTPNAMNELAQLNDLKDIHLPPPVGVWPFAWGWWLLAIVLVLLVTALLNFGIKRYRKNAYRRAALKELHIIETLYRQGAVNGLNFESALVQVLKRTALTAYPRSQVARLTGETWLQTMDQLAGFKQFDSALGRCLLDQRFAPPTTHLDTTQAQALLQLTRDWIKQHR